ncbi:hypothetical protein HNV10_09650 [Winogradskyella litoriviva]|uniref:SGNH/GDSL hydrolase family protein n=1 Tax=Winogradskyella litoriviva TaxID=1220182 RepID=A0ABX2E4T5_9FLAO|nr:hypothetical protein [Winogradskyella litoriviva]NRD23503.1 hypothetical protein [Winogradskyella litoriviva]
MIIAILTVVAIAIIPITIIKNQSKFKIDENSTYVVFGHSHPSYAYNDSIIKNFKNLADAGESYFYTYQKVKNIIPNNPQIQTVFIEFTNNQIDSKINEWIWGFEKMSYFLPTYLTFINKEDFSLLYDNNREDLTSCLSIAAKKNIYRTINNDFNIINSIDGYKSTKINKLDEMLEEAKSDTTNYGINYKISESNINYLKKIITFCKAHNKDVFLIRSPQHKDLPVLKNENYYQDIKKKHFKNVTLLDFNSFKLPNTFYVDLDHLNSLGANRFSKMFNNLLINDLLKSKDSKSKINEAIATYSLSK